ncbi:MAG TPA: FGGY-family carbohydrate kinase [Acidimicrobiales bacterium]|nr:FGGY-family carbohydrate kinase [Acidimicrobiales bacterium]
MRVAAVDLGATSARIAIVDSGDPDRVDVVHRYAHQPVTHDDGTLRWDWNALVAEVERGLTLALEAGPLDSIGVDTWGVDYGLIDDAGALVAAPFCYRDPRTDSWHSVVERLGDKLLYTDTGVQLLAINTIFQLAVHDRAELARAAHVLLLPELLVHHLTGAITAEITSAATTGLVSLHTGTWDEELFELIDVPIGLMPAIAAPGTRVGAWRDVPVHLVGGHDTASAVFARPGGRAEDRAFVSTGSWVLVGVERDEPCTTRMARLANFSNERGVDGGYRFLKNITGLWLFERCRDQWPDASLDQLVAAAEAARGGVVVNTDDPRLAGVANVPKAIADLTELDADDRGAVVRCIFESIAAAAAGVIEQIGHVTGTPVRALDLLGGGTQIPLLVALIERATQLPCTVGPVEAAALGNARVQLRALAQQRPN